MKSIKLAIILLMFMPMFAYSMHSDRMGSIENSAVEQIKPQIQQLMAINHIPGLAIALVDNQGSLWAQGYGYTDTQQSHKVTENTLFSVQSQSKMVTATGVLIAVEKKYVSLDTPIINYLPDLKAYCRGDSNPVSKITLKQLLSHTAGFSHDAPIGNNNNASPPFQSHMDSILAGTWLQFCPGTDYSYSNVGIEIAGYILQKKTNIPFITFMKDEVLQPLDMKNSTYDINKVVHIKDRALGTITGFKDAPLNYSMLAPAGLYSTAIDMGHYISFQLNQGVYNHQTVLSNNDIKLMQTIPYPKPGQQTGTALGLWRGIHNNDVYYGHLGRGFGYSSTSIWYPAYNIGVTVLTNGYGTNSDLTIANKLLDTIIAARKQKELSLLIPKMLGTYVSNGFTTISFSVINDGPGLAIKGYLNEDIEGNIVKQGIFPLQYEGSNVFYNTVDHQRYRFSSHSATGAATLTRISDGATYYFNDNTNSSNKNVSAAQLKQWKKYVGTYFLPSYGNPIKLSIYIKNNYLYLNQFKLQYYQPGIFFAANGAALILKKGELSWDNIKIVSHSK